MAIQVGAVETRFFFLIFLYGRKLFYMAERNLFICRTFFRGKTKDSMIVPRFATTFLVRKLTCVKGGLLFSL